MTFFGRANKHSLLRQGLLLAAPLSVLIAACSGGSDSSDASNDIATGNTAERDQSTPSQTDPGKLLFTQCAACHAIEANAPTKVGPNLNCILDRPAGNLADFNYSDAFKKAASDGVVFDRETLSSFITNSKAVVPGNTMAFGGVSDEERRAKIIDYLAQQCGGADDQ